MPTIFYLDTCIWKDHFENRCGQGGRPLGDFATQLIQKIIKTKDKIIYSDLTIDELLFHHDPEEITEMLAVLNHTGILRKVEISTQDRSMASKLSQTTGIHETDAIHAVLAKEHQAILISQDRHFQLVKDFIQVK